jgi:hypothetical protein
MSTHSRLSRFGMALAALAAGMTLAACGGSGGAMQSVASLPGASTAAPVAQPTTTSALDGVTIPANSSPAQMARIMNAWASCMERHGYHNFAVKDQDGIQMKVQQGNDLNRFPDAVNACKSLQPHPPWQEMPDRNPQYAADMASWISCMNHRGLAVHGDAGGWTFDHADLNMPGDQLARIELQCRLQAFHEQ